MLASIRKDRFEKLRNHLQMYESPMNSAIEYEYYWQFAPDVFLASSQN